MTYPEFTITYISEHGREYSVGLSGCHTLRRLREYLEHWYPFCSDAYQIAWDMDSKSWKEFKHGWALEKAGTFAGDEWNEKYAAILMPAFLFRVSMIAAKFEVPWGCAFIRLQEEKIVQRRDGVYVWVDPAESEK